jgi:hypothetical protein
VKISKFSLKIQYVEVAINGVLLYFFLQALLYSSFFLKFVGEGSIRFWPIRRLSSSIFRSVPN